MLSSFTKIFFPFITGNFRKLKPESFIEWKAPVFSLFSTKKFVKVTNLIPCQF